MSDDSGAEVMAKQGSITFLGNIGKKILGFAFLAIVTRLVSPTVFGVYSLALSVVLFVQGFSNLNLHRSIDYFLPQYLNDDDYAKARLTLLWTTGVGILSTVVAAVLVISSRRVLADIFSEPLLVDLLPFLCLVLPLSAVLNSVTTLFTSIKQMKYVVYTKYLTLPVAKLVLTVGLIYSGFSLFGLVGGYVLAFVVATAVGAILVLRNVNWVLGTDRKRVSKKDILSYSLPLAFVGAIYATVAQVDYFVIGYFTAADSVGQYRVAFTLAGNLLLFISSLTPIFKPMIVEKKEARAALRSRYQLATRWVVITTLPAAITLAIAAETYLLVFFTDEYTVTSAVVMVLATGYVINTLGGPQGMVIEGLGYTKLTLFNTVAMILTNTILNILLVPQIGILGAGIGTLGAYTVAVALGVSELYYLKQIHPFSKNLLKSLLAGIPVLLSTYLVNSIFSNAILLAAILPVVALVVYLGTLNIIRGFIHRDRTVAEKIDTKLGYDLFSYVIPQEKS